MKNQFKTIKSNSKWIVPSFILGLLFGWILFHNPGDVTTQINHDGHIYEEAEATIWTCSMHPQIRQDKPGKCPICAMDLIPLVSMLEEGEDFDPNEIQMTESAAKLADIQTLIIEKGTPQKTIYLQGKVQPDERNIAELTARFGGRIEKLFVNFTGQNVRKGEKLATIYSPELVTAQRELLEAVSYKETRPALYRAARGKLRLWDLSEAQISSIEKKGEPQLYFDILSPITGTVAMRYVTLGDYVKEGKALFKVIDLSRVWAMFDAYESDMPWIKIGDPVDFTIQSLPGKQIEGKVTYIDPFINPVTRVAKVRVELNNPKLTIKPEMFAKGILKSKIAENTDEILIPKSSILWTGKRAVVYVKVPNRENPSFLYREILLGPEAGRFFLVNEGLNEGEEIATNGVFKIDAAAQLQGLPSMMNPEGGAMPTGHQHGELGNASQMRSPKPASMEMKDQHYMAGLKFKKQLTQVYHAYLEMKNAFVASDSKMVRQKARDVIQEIQAIDMALLKGDAHMAWMDYLTILNKTINEISDRKKLEIQRTAFVEFNLAFYKAIKAFGLDGEVTYYQYCPMANRDQGAYWLSESKEIRNPYFGEAMLGCGETRETLK